MAFTNFGITSLFTSRRSQLKFPFFFCYVTLSANRCVYFKILHTVSIGVGGPRPCNSVNREREAWRTHAVKRDSRTDLLNALLMSEWQVGCSSHTPPPENASGPVTSVKIKCFTALTKKYGLLFFVVVFFYTRHEVLRYVRCFKMSI